MQVNQPALAAPLDIDTVVVDALADRLDAFRLKQEVIVDEVHRAVAVSLSCLNSATTCSGLRDRHLPSLKIGMSQKTHGQGQPREVCIVV